MCKIFGPKIQSCKFFLTNFKSALAKVMFNGSLTSAADSGTLLDSSLKSLQWTEMDNGSLPPQLNAGKVLELDLSSSKMPVSPSSVKGSNLAASARLLGA